MGRGKESFRLVEQMIVDVPTAASSSEQDAYAYEHIANKEPRA